MENLHLVLFLTTFGEDARPAYIGTRESVLRLMKDESAANDVIMHTLYRASHVLKGINADAPSFVPSLYRLAFLRVLDAYKWQWYPHPNDSAAESVYEEARAFEVQMAQVNHQKRVELSRAVPGGVDRLDPVIGATIGSVEMARTLYSRLFPLYDDLGDSGRSAPLAPDPTGRVPGNARTFEEAIELPRNP